MKDPSIGGNCHEYVNECETCVVELAQFGTGFFRDNPVSGIAMDLRLILQARNQAIVIGISADGRDLSRKTLFAGSPRPNPLRAAETALATGPFRISFGVAIDRRRKWRATSLPPIRFLSGCRMAGSPSPVYMSSRLGWILQANRRGPAEIRKRNGSYHRAQAVAELLRGLDQTQLIELLENCADSDSGLRARVGPTLKPGDIVVMDNLSSHKTVGVREAIEAVGAELRYLRARQTLIRSSSCSPNSKPL